jgi:hypothetical protein
VAFSCKVEVLLNGITNSRIYADFKADENLKKGFPEKSNNPTVVLIMSKNGKNFKIPSLFC